MKGARLVAAGPVEEVLVSATVSDAFGVSVTVERHGGRWSARAAPAPAPGAGPVRDRSAG
jgi:iron complex transport system ATP-binding protein